MALSPLASVADLADRKIYDSNATTALEVASSVIRDAAGVPISQTTATITTVAPTGRLLSLPGPVTEVTAVTLDGATVADWRNIGTGLWRACGWGCEPAPVQVTATFGLADVPPDIVDLACNLAKAWLDHRGEGGGSTAGLSSVRIDDAAESYTDEAAGQVSPVFLPEATRRWLSARFSGGAFVVETL